MSKLVEPEKVDKLIEIADEIADYLEFKQVIDLGFQIHHSELPFEKIILFSWIREALEHGREHRVQTSGNRR